MCAVLFIDKALFELYKSIIPSEILRNRQTLLAIFLIGCRFSVDLGRDTSHDFTQHVLSVKPVENVVGKRSMMMMMMYIPKQEFGRIVKAEHVIIILHVVLIQQSVQLL